MYKHPLEPSLQLQYPDKNIVCRWTDFSRRLAASLLPEGYLPPLNNTYRYPGVLLPLIYAARSAAPPICLLLDGIFKWQRGAVTITKWDLSLPHQSSDFPWEELAAGVRDKEEKERRHSSTEVDHHVREMFVSRKIDGSRLLVQLFCSLYRPLKGSVFYPHLLLIQTIKFYPSPRQFFHRLTGLDCNGRESFFNGLADQTWPTLRKRDQKSIKRRQFLAETLHRF